MEIKSPVKILYFITTLDIGGAEQLLLSILRGLNKREYEPMVCCLYGGELAKEIKNLGIKVIDLKVKNKFNLMYLFKLYKFLKKEKFDIVHTHLFHANIIGRIMARLSKVPIVVSTQHYAFKYNGKAGVYLEKLTTKLSNRIVAVSDAAKKFYINEVGVSPDRITLIYNGVDLDILKVTLTDKLSLREQLSLNTDFILGCIGSFSKFKGHIYLLKAITEVIKVHKNIKLLLVGSGLLEKYLMKVTKDLGISKNVIFLHRRRDIPRILTSFDICILPSLQEGLSIILLEAMAMGKPVIATAVGGNSEVIIHGKNGLLIPPSDYRAIADAIIDLIRDDNKARQLAANARLTVTERFNIKENIYKTESLYEELIDSYKKKI